jgi:pantoate--beta-alanine ligase
VQVIQTIKQLKEYVNELKKTNKTIGLVPTMGYLHDGHLTLARTAKGENDVVIMSIFVNPTQFGPNEDFASYPRDLNRDCVLAESAGVDVVFAPSEEDMYPTPSGIKLSVGQQASILCGASRPGHFDGVVQVVTKLFHLAQANRAYFGQKDAQQVAIIETLVRDFNFPLEIKVVPIVREEDGLAKSSRNVYLTVSERAEAPAIFAALNAAKSMFMQSKNVQLSVEAAKKYVVEHTSGTIDYLEFLSYPDLTEVNEQTTRYIIAAAVYIGKTRLIDNIIFSVKGE